MQIKTQESISTLQLIVKFYVTSGGCEWCKDVTEERCALQLELYNMIENKNIFYDYFKGNSTVI